MFVVDVDQYVNTLNLKMKGYILEHDKTVSNLFIYKYVDTQLYVTFGQAVFCNAMLLTASRNNFH